jgi:hypothetical protein
MEYNIPAVTGIGDVNVKLWGCKLPAVAEIVVLPKIVPLRLSPVVTIAVIISELYVSAATTSTMDRKPEIEGTKVW